MARTTKQPSPFKKSVQTSTHAQPTASVTNNKPSFVSLLLHESTDDFMKKLKTRGYSVNFKLRDWLICELTNGFEQCAKCGNDSILSCHTHDFWMGVDLQRIQQTKTNESQDHHSLLPINCYCALLCGLQALDINYVDLAVVLYGLSIREIQNFYRYCYLEWMQHHAIPDQHSKPTSITVGSSQDKELHKTKDLWPCTPREFSRLTTEELRVQWTESLQRLLAPYSSPPQPPSSPTNNSQRVRSLFFVNRLYSYLTPCG